MSAIMRATFGSGRGEGRPRKRYQRVMLTAPRVLGTVRENGSSHLASAAEFQEQPVTAFGDNPPLAVCKRERPLDVLRTDSRKDQRQGEAWPKPDVRRGEPADMVSLITR